MYFTDTAELRKLEREMRQKPNFDRRNDDENEDVHFSENKKSEIKGKNDGGK